MLCKVSDRSFYLLLANMRFHKTTKSSRHLKHTVAKELNLWGYFEQQTNINCSLSSHFSIRRRSILILPPFIALLHHPPLSRRSSVSGFARMLDDRMLHDKRLHDDDDDNVADDYHDNDVTSTTVALDTTAAVSF